MERQQITHDQRTDLMKLLHHRLTRMEVILTTIAKAVQAAPSQARRCGLKARKQRVLPLHRQTRELHAFLFSAEFCPFIGPRRVARTSFYG